MELTPQFAKASETLANSLLNDGKLLVLGTGASAALAQIFVAHLMHRSIANGQGFQQLRFPPMWSP